MNDGILDERRTFAKYAPHLPRIVDADCRVGHNINPAVLPR